MLVLGFGGYAKGTSEIYSQKSYEDILCLLLKRIFGHVEEK
jgi:hypothetical protein